MATTHLAGAAVAVAISLVATPYLARLTVTVPDKDNAAWWKGAPLGRDRTLRTALAAVVVGGLAGSAAGLSALLPAFLALALAGIPLVVIDYEHHRLPNRLVYPAAGAAVALLALAAAVQHDWSAYLRSIEAGAVVYVVLFVLMLIAPRSFGWGDVRLGGILGLYLGHTSWVDVYYGIFAGFLLGSLVAVVLLVLRKADRKTPIAFGPMLLVGALLLLALDIDPSLGN